MIFLQRHWTTEFNLTCTAFINLPIGPANDKNRQPTLSQGAVASVWGRIKIVLLDRPVGREEPGVVIKILHCFFDF